MKGRGNKELTIPILGSEVCGSSNVEAIRNVEEEVIIENVKGEKKNKLETEGIAQLATIEMVGSHYANSRDKNSKETIGK